YMFLSRLHFRKHSNVSDELLAHIGHVEIGALFLAENFFGQLKTTLGRITMNLHHDLAVLPLLSGLRLQPFLTLFSELPLLTSLSWLSSGLLLLTNLRLSERRFLVVLLTLGCGLVIRRIGVIAGLLRDRGVGGARSR